MGRRIVWFSCGVASAVAAHITLQRFDDVAVVYCDTSQTEHPDNLRFLRDCERWLGHPIELIRSNTYASVDDVFDRTRYMSGLAGARCTVEMKKVPRFNFQRWDDIHIFGYHAGEEGRARRLATQNPELNLEWPLLSSSLDKQDCHSIIRSAGIELPAMYKLGFRNNNCIGCVKATAPDYWNKVRKLFPSVYQHRALLSREINARLTRKKVGKKWVRIFLDELEESNQLSFDEDLSCGPDCK